MFSHPLSHVVTCLSDCSLEFPSSASPRKELLPTLQGLAQLWPLREDASCQPEADLSAWLKLLQGEVFRLPGSHLHCTGIYGL